MARKVTSRTGLRFLGNSSASKMEVHELAKENKNCQIDEILRAGNAVGFSPDTLAQAQSEGYDNCHWCVGGSTR
jgi:PHP family Zn ribbon phosphoesterase